MNARSAAARLKAPVQASVEPAARGEEDPTARRVRDANRRRLTVQGLRILVAVVWLGSWELTTQAGWVDKFFFAQPSAIVLKLWTWINNGTELGPLWLQVLTTMEETVGGFVVGSIFGIVVGVALGRSLILADVLGPYVKAFNAIPRVVLGALFAISLGLDIKSKVATAAILVFFVVFFNAFQGAREVDRNLIANARILGANQRQLSTAVIIPSALTWIIASLHTSFSFALVGAVVGEFLGSTQGIGLLIQTAQGAFNANGVFAATVQ